MTPDPWLSMRFRITVQYVDRPSKGHWFATELGGWYEARVAEVRQQDEMAAQEKAEEDKRMAEWTARREKERLEEEAKADQERQATERTAAQVAARAKREGAAQEQRAQEMLALREQEREQEAALRSERHVTIHVVEEGFTALGQVFPCGFELALDRESPGWQATVDRDGHSWVDQTEAQQKRRYGKVYFRRGPWPRQGTCSGVATLSPYGLLERPSAEKKYPIGRAPAER